jgi:hypothetical protein
MWEVIDVYNSEVVGACPTNALNASRRLWGRARPERSDARPQPALVCKTTLTKRPRATARLARDRAGRPVRNPQPAPWRGLIDRSQTGATPPGKIFSLSTRQCLSCAGPKSPAGHGRAFQAARFVIFIPSDADCDDRPADWISERKKLEPRGDYIWP